MGGQTALAGENKGVTLGSDHGAFLSDCFSVGERVPQHTDLSSHTAEGWTSQQQLDQVRMPAVEHVASSPCGQGIPCPVLKPAVTQIFQMRCWPKKVFQDLGIRDTDPEIPGLAKQ